MEHVLRGLQWEECLVYMDDIIIPGSSVEQSLERLSHVLERLRDANLKLKPSKCSLFRQSVPFLGHAVSHSGIYTDPAKIEAVRDWPIPISAKQVRSFLGLCSYYRKFIHCFADIACPLHKLTEKDATFIWAPECQEAFQKLKTALISAPILAYPRPEGQFTLDTDASGVAVGAVLSQLQDEEQKVIGYFSKALTKPEQAYCTTRKELLAVVLALKHFQPYVYGRTTVLRTDNAAVSWMRSLKNPTGQVARWLQGLGEYDLIVTHHPGRIHNNADALSRRPCAPCAHQQSLSEKYQQDEEEDNPPRDEAGPLGGAGVCLATTSSLKTTHIYFEIRGLSLSQSLGLQESAEEDMSPPDETGPQGEAGLHLGATTRQQAIPAQGTLRRNQGWLDGWDVDQMRLAQLQDEVIGPILLQYEEDPEKPDWPTLSHLPAGSKEIWSNWRNLNIKDGLMFRRFYNSKAKKDSWQLLVPKAKQKEVFQHLHEHNTGGHIGTERTIHKINQAFYWPNMRQVIQEMCRKCDRCAVRKPPLKNNRAPLKQYLVGEPMERIAIDILGPLPRTRQGNRFVLVISDYFTKYAEAVALPDFEAETVAKAVVEQFICRFGTPRQLHSDRATNFESKVFQNVCKLLNIHKTRTTSRNPQSDGMVERFNRTLATMLTMYCESKQNTWDQHLPYVMLAYRSSVHDSTGFSPNMMMLGREVELPLQAVVGSPQGEPWETTEDYVSLLQERLQDAHREARRHLQRSAQYQQRAYEHRNVAQRQFNVGDAVWYHNSSLKKGHCKKFTSPWKGPYIVVKQISDVVYLLKLKPRADPISVHVNKMKMYRGDKPPQWWRGDDR